MTIAKVLNVSFPLAGQVAEYRHEFQILQSITSPHVPRPFGFYNEDKFTGILMEDIGSTGSLDMSINRNIGFLQGLRLGMQAAEALRALHSAGFIHRDLSPSNLIYSEKLDRLQLIDYGQATECTLNINSTAKEGSLACTLPYVSPEQTGRIRCTVDHRSDFYSLGMVLFELLAGELPFNADDMIGWIYCHLAKKPPLLNQVCPEVPPEVAAIIDRLLEKDKELRYQSADEIVSDLRTCVAQLEMDGVIGQFKSSHRSVSEHFLIPQKLYGRRKQLSDLLNMFERVTKEGKHGEMAIVTGSPGIGKSSLVQGIQVSIIEKHGIFIEGKFDQRRSARPLSGVLSAFDDLIRHIMRESKKKTCSMAKCYSGRARQQLRDAYRFVPRF